MKKSIVTTETGNKYLIPFILITSLFFFWGFAHSFLDVLNKHFQEILSISKADSGYIQMVVYGGYFLMALPAGWAIKKFGYRISVILGLTLYGIGALMFIPGSKMMSFPFFLLSLFIIGSGLTFLETAANPYVTFLGEKKTASSRLNLSQSFNGLGWVMGPFIGGMLVFSDDANFALPYTIVGVIVLLVAMVFIRVPLPEITNTQFYNQQTLNNKPLIKQPHFVFGAIALFFYVAAQTGVNSFFINYVTETVSNISNQQASLLLSFGGMGLFMVGRFLGSRIMRYIKPSKLLALFALGSTICMVLVILKVDYISIIALILNYLFMSIMFPTVFSLAIRNLEQKTPQASSILIMSIVGGAIAPYLMGVIGNTNMANGFIIPLVCFIIVFIYAIHYSKNKVLNS